MKNYLKIVQIIGVGVAVISLNACTSQTSYNQKHFKRYAYSVHPIVVPSDTKIVKKEPYYQLPIGAAHVQAKPVSLIPPGSNILQYQKKSHDKKQNRQSSLPISKKLVQSKLGTEKIILSLKPAVAWEKLGEALRKSHYQILEKDKGMHSYYVLDSSKTHNKITQATPIYRVYVNAKGKYTEVGLMNHSNQPPNSKTTHRILKAIQLHIA